MNLDQPEQLLDHGHLLRSLAGALLHSATDVDDVVQNTFTAAIQKPRPTGWPLPQWLAGVTRNLARRQLRDQARRAARERAAAKPEALRSTAELVELEELRGLVVAAVLELDEPYRSAVLLRYYDGLTPRAIARRLGIPAATVRSHLSRALARLRQRLDRDHRGGRAAWTALLLPLATTAPTAPGTMALVAKLAALPVLAVAAFWLYAAATPAAPTAGATTAPTAASLRPETTAPTRDNATAARQEVGLATPVVAPPLPSIALRFRNHDGQIVAGEVLRQQFVAAATATEALWLDATMLQRSGIEGVIAARFGPSSAWQTPSALAFAEDHATLATTPARGTFHLLVPRPHAPAELTPAIVLPLTAPVAFDVVLPAPSSRRLLRFVAADTGAALAGAAVTAYTEFGDDLSFVPGTVMTTDARGECAWSTAEHKNPLLLRPAALWLESPGHAGRFTVAPGGEVLEVRIAPRGTIVGTAHLPDGVLAAGRTIAYASNKGPTVRAIVGDDGQFTVRNVPATEGMLVLVDDGDTNLQAASVAVPAGNTCAARIGTAQPGPTLRGRLTTGGQPLAGALVLVVPAARRDDRRFAQTEADGRYALRDVPDGSRFLVLLGDPAVADDFTIRREAPLDAAALAAAAFDFDLPRGVVRVQVVDATSGTPLAGVPVTAQAKAEGSMADRFPGFVFRAGWGATTAADGSATLRCLPEGEAIVVRAGGRAHVQQSIELPSAQLGDGGETIVVRVGKKP